MRKFLFFMTFTFSLLTSMSAQPGVAENYIQFEQKTVDLGKITKGDKVELSFIFKNISNENVQIDLVTSCECTDVSWTMTEIRPGQKGKIKATFNSAKKDTIEPIDIDLILINTDPKSGNPIFDMLSYTYDF